jgi:hypothetical protein
MSIKKLNLLTGCLVDLKSQILGKKKTKSIGIASPYYWTSIGKKGSKDEVVKSNMVSFMKFQGK